MMEAQPIRLGLLQYPVGRPASIADFAARLDRWLEEGRASADLLVLPEYAAVELGVALNGGEASEAAELSAMITAAPAILEAMRDAARRHQVWLQPGTLPMRAADGRVVNRAPLITPEGRIAFQEKRAMTRFETEHSAKAPIPMCLIRPGAGSAFPSAMISNSRSMRACR
jgi:predicted amidohydrolase